MECKLFKQSCNKNNNDNNNKNFNYICTNVIFTTFLPLLTSLFFLFLQASPSMCIYYNETKRLNANTNTTVIPSFVIL